MARPQQHVHQDRDHLQVVAVLPLGRGDHALDAGGLLQLRHGGLLPRGQAVQRRRGEHPQRRYGNQQQARPAPPPQHRQQQRQHQLQQRGGELHRHAAGHPNAVGPQVSQYRAHDQRLLFPLMVLQENDTTSRRQVNPQIVVARN